MGSSDSHAVALGDLDGDGDLDAFVGNFRQANRVWLNDGSGRFIDSDQDFPVSRTLGVSLGDLDGDGDLDALSQNDGLTRVWLNNGSGLFTQGASTLIISGAGVLPLGDLDGDGDLDTIGGQYVWLNDR